MRVDERDVMAVVDAAGAALSADLLDKALMSIRFNSVRLESPRYASHSIQTLMYERLGYAFSDVNGKRVAHNGVEWKADDSLPLDCVLVETEGGLALIKNLYPSCPMCLECRVEKALEAEGLLKRERFEPIEVMGKPLSETIIEDRR